MNAPLPVQLSREIAQDAARWQAFVAACSMDWNDLPEAWQDFFYMMGDEKKCAPGALDRQIDEARKGD